KAAGFWGRQESTIIDGEVVDRSTPGDESRPGIDRGDPNARLQDFERQFIDLVKKYRKDGDGP
ncbi:MAG: hypothetical protein KJ645_12420, partial [Planctomycetes bacterium]|nr:hypothetical protein [Planctomycetota bacterium]